MLRLTHILQVSIQVLIIFSLFEISLSVLCSDQAGFDPYNSDAGNGLFPNGSYVIPVPDQNNVYVAWNTSAAKQWLSGMKNKPKIVTIDNEIEIASNTHQDMHPM